LSEITTTTISINPNSFYPNCFRSHNIIYYRIANKQDFICQKRAIIQDLSEKMTGRLITFQIFRSIYFMNGNIIILHNAFKHIVIRIRTNENQIVFHKIM